jgi:uncharacterized protein (TIRG00374 family)
MPLSKSKWKRLLKLLGPILFIFLFIRVVDPRTTADLLKTIRPEIVLISIFLFPVVNAVLTVRWWLICQRLELKASFKDLFQIYYTAWFLSLLPLAGISFISKLIYLKEEGKPSDVAAISITLDKLLDIMGHLLFGLFGLVYFPKSIFKDLHFWNFFGGMLIFAVVILVYRHKLLKYLKFLLKRYSNKKLQGIGRNLEVKLAGFWNNFSLEFFSLILGISISIGILRSLVLYLLAISLDINVSFGFIIACRAFIGIVNVIPISISGLGTRDSILLLTLPILGVPMEAAIALGFLAFLWIICSKFSGIVFWLKRPLPTKSLLVIKEKLML